VGHVVAFVPDLLFGSSVASALQAAGHQYRLVATLEPSDLDGAELLIVDLTADARQRVDAVIADRSPELPVLAFYSHVEADVRAMAEEAGLTMVVPRSRMAREGAELVARLLHSPAG
jgi:hypothetical protein